MMNLILWAIPIFCISMLIEWRLTLGDNYKGYALKDSATSLSMGVGNLLLMLVTKTITLAIYFAVWEYHLFEILTQAWWAWLLLIPCEDFCYYWYHRAGHTIRFCWAAHVNHHSSQSYNLSTALRQSWTSPFFGWVFWLPLPFLGFHPMMVILAQSISLLYQYWIHTELIGKMRIFGLVFNTPSHHRVHHGHNPHYLDRNFGGILIIWDRLFGSFEAEKEAPEFGLIENLHSYNPLVVAFHEWHAIAKDIQTARSWRGRLGYFFGPPGWREDGTGKTVKERQQHSLVP